MSKQSLMPHQVSELAFLRRQPRAFLFSETGTGKTPTLSRYADETLQAGQRVLWLTDAGLIEQLKMEAVCWLSPRSPQPVDLRRAPAAALFVAASHKWGAENIDTLPEVDLVIVDEADASGTGGEKPNSPTFTGIKRACSLAPRSVLATATPVASVHGLDLYALLEAGQCPDLLARSQFLTFVRYSEFDTGWGKKTVPTGLGQRGVQCLQRYVAQVAVATRLSDLTVRLPGIVKEDVPVLLGSAALAEYEEIRANKSGLARHLQSVRAVRGPEGLARATAKAIVATVGRGETHILVYTEHFDMLDAVLSELAKTGLPTWKLTGKETMPARQRAIDEHKRSANGVLIGTRAIETGLNLQHCSTLISVMASWSYSRESQREGRIRRTGSPYDTVRHVRIAPKVSLEEARKDRVEVKRELHTNIMSAVPRAHSAQTLSTA